MKDHNHTKRILYQYGTGTSQPQTPTIQDISTHKTTALCPVQAATSLSKAYETINGLVTTPTFCET